SVQGAPVEPAGGHAPGAARRARAGIPLPVHEAFDRGNPAARQPDRPARERFLACRGGRRAPGRLRARRRGGGLKTRRQKAEGSRQPVEAGKGLPTEMTAVVKTKPLPGPDGTEIKTVPVPVPGQAEVLIKVLATAVCGSDKHIYQWDASMASM